MDVIVCFLFLLVAAPVAEWLRTLIFSALNPNHLTAVGSHRCETSQVLLADDQVVFLGDLPFSPYLNHWLGSKLMK